MIIKPFSKFFVDVFVAWLAFSEVWMEQLLLLGEVCFRL